MCTTAYPFGRQLIPARCSKDYRGRISLQQPVSCCRVPQSDTTCQRRSCGPPPLTGSRELWLGSLALSRSKNAAYIISCAKVLRRPMLGHPSLPLQLHATAQWSEAILAFQNTSSYLPRRVFVHPSSIFFGAASTTFPGPCDLTSR
jgi:hypothetical protein